MSSRFTQYILIAMALGIAMGTIVFNYLPDSRVEIAADVNLIAMLFLRLIKMIIAPLVFATLVGGIAHMGSGAKLGRIFAKTMGWFVSASFVSLNRRTFSRAMTACAANALRSSSSRGLNGPGVLRRSASPPMASPSRRSGVVSIARKPNRSPAGLDAGYAASFRTSAVR